VRDVEPLAYHAVRRVQSAPIILHRAAARYAAFGLTLVSRYPLPLPESIEPSDEIGIAFAASDRHAPLDGGPRRRAWIPNATGGELLFEDGGGYRLAIEIARDRMSIAFNRPDEDVSGVILGAAMGALLHLRHTPALHGTAVVWQGGAYVIGGASGAGKTTLASVLVATAGAKVVSDDLSALEIDSGTCAVRSGAPARLTIEEAARVEPRHSVTTAPGTDGKHWLLPSSGAPDVVPLRAVLLLEPRTTLEAPRVERLPRAVACARLASSLYGAAWLGMTRERQLSTAADIAQRTPVYRVALPDNRAALPRHARAMLTHAYE
jgi:hypothetical protein